MVEQPVAPTPDAPRRRMRRTGAEIRRVLLDTARERFASQGYAGAATRTIAADAGASESLIFTHFRSKAGLFEAAVLEPIAGFIDDYVLAFHQRPRSESLAVETRLYVAGMYELLRAHRRLVLALIAADAFEDDPLEGRVGATFARLLEPVERMVSGEVSLRGWQEFDPKVVVRGMLGMIVSMSVLDGLLYDDADERPADEHVVDQLTRLLVDGYRGLR
jgi:AcrR family transcriptional regulator